MDPEIAALYPDLVARVEALLVKITIAFDGVPRPRITISVAEGLDNAWYPSEARCWELNAQDPEQVWTDVTDEQIKSNHSYFRFSDDEGWRFYLPAHMSMVLRDFPYGSYNFVYAACVDKNPCFALLNEAQMECVQEFVALVKEAGAHPY